MIAKNERRLGILETGEDWIDAVQRVFDWLDYDFLNMLSNIDLTPVGTRNRDEMINQLFRALASRMFAFGVVTRARVKQNVCRAIGYSVREFESEMTQARHYWAMQLVLSVQEKPVTTC